MTTFVYLVVAGNIIDDYNEGNESTDNVIEVFDNCKAAEEFGTLYDFCKITQKELRTIGIRAA
jgi:hypothetical protein